MLNLEFYNIRIERAEHSNEVVVKGEVTNRTARNFNSVAVRVVLFVKSIAIANFVILINGLYSGASKAFETTVEDIQYDVIGKEINHYEIFAESAY